MVPDERATIEHTGARLRLATDLGELGDEAGPVARLGNKYGLFVRKQRQQHLLNGVPEVVPFHDEIQYQPSRATRT